MSRYTIVITLIFLSIAAQGWATPLPVAHYSFSGNAQALGVNGNDGTIYGATAGPDRNGVAGGALQFDGVDDYIRVADAPTLDFTDAFSMSTWFAWAGLATNGNGHQRIISKSSNWEHTVESYAVWIDEGPKEAGGPHHYGSVNVRLNAERDLGVESRAQIIFDTGLTADRWYHLAVTYDGSLTRVFIDGVEETGYLDIAAPDYFSGPIVSSDYNLYIGDSGQENPIEWLHERHFNGAIDDLLLFDVALTSEEVLQLFQTSQPIPEPATLALLSAGLCGVAIVRRKCR